MFCRIFYKEDLVFVYFQREQWNLTSTKHGRLVSNKSYYHYTKWCSIHRGRSVFGTGTFETRMRTLWSLRLSFNRPFPSYKNWKPELVKDETELSRTWTRVIKLGLRLYYEALSPLATPSLARPLRGIQTRFARLTYCENSWGRPMVTLNLNELEQILLELTSANCSSISFEMLRKQIAKLDNCFGCIYICILNPTSYHRRTTDNI